MPRLFISHSSKDSIHALAFRRWLETKGWSTNDVFIDLHDMKAGERWRETLVKANVACEALLYLASPEALDSGECRREVRRAEDDRKDVIVAILRDVSVGDPRLASYSERQIIDLSTNPREERVDVEYQGHRYLIDFNRAALNAIHAKLIEKGIAPDSFEWPPRHDHKAAPYPGLDAFDEHSAAIFFGRDADIMTGIRDLRQIRHRGSPRLLVIQAASGAGKSSFLRAGLWPKLTRTAEFVPVAILRPATGIITGRNGIGQGVAQWFGNRKRPIAPGVIQKELMQGDAKTGATAFARYLSQAVALMVEERSLGQPDDASRVRLSPLIAIDQGEELFAAEDAVESDRFLEVLGVLLASPPDGLDPYVLVTIRADSIDALLQRVPAMKIETPEVVALPPLSLAAYRDVITKPAEVYTRQVQRLDLDPELVAGLVKGATGADALPLLAFSLQRLFIDYAPEQRLTLAHYDAMGGIGGSIRRKLAEAQAKAGATGSDANLRRLVVPRLATWDPDADHRGGAAKRLVARLEEAVGGDRAQLAPLADALVEVRLLSRGRDTLEVAHETLLRQPPISDWLAEDREFLVWRDRLGRERIQFEGNARGLLVGRELQIAREWLETRATDIASAERDFIETSATEDDRRRNQDEEHQRQRQAAELDASRRLVRRTAMGLAATLVLAVLAGLAGVYGFSQQKAAQAAAQIALRARDEALLNQSRFLTKEAVLAIEQGDAASGILLALEAVQDANGDDDSTKTRPRWAQAEAALLSAVHMLRERLILKGHSDSVYGVAMTPDGARLVTVSGDNIARVWNAKTGKELLQLKGHSDTVYGVAVTPDGARIVTVSADSTARVWDANTGKELLQLKGHSDTVYGVAVTPDGARLVTVSADNTARVWDANTGKGLLQLKGHSNTVYGVAMTPDGARIVTVSGDNTARVWDADTGKELLQFQDHTNTVYGVAVTPDGARIVTVSDDSTARVWDANTGKELLQLKGHSKGVNGVAVTPDGARIITVSADSTARVWDANTGNLLLQLKGHIDSVYGVAVTSDGARIVTVSGDRTARVWDARTGNDLLQLKGHTTGVNGVAVTPDGARIVTGSGDSTARVWDADTGNELLQLKDHTGTVYVVAVTPDGARIVTGSADSTARVWDANTGKELLQLKGHSDTVYGVAVTPDGARIITVSGDNTARVWDANTGKELLQLRVHTGGLYGVTVTPDGARIVAVSGDRTARVWDARNGKELLQLKGHSDTVNGVAVTPDGARIVTVSADSTARVWDARNGKELLQLKGHTGGLYGVAVTPDGTRIITVSGDSTARVWDARNGSELLQLTGHTGTVHGVAVTPDGTRIVTGSFDNTAQVWLLTPPGQALIDEAKMLVPRCLTPAERQRAYLEPAPSRWCGTMEKWPYDAVSGVVEGPRLASKGKDDEAAAVFAFAKTLARDPAAAKRIDEAWADAYVRRGRDLLNDRRDEEATAQFDKALARDPAAAKRIDEAWANAYVGRGRYLLNDQRDEEAAAEFAKALARDPAAANRIDEASAEAYVGRGPQRLQTTARPSARPSRW